MIVWGLSEESQRDRSSSFLPLCQIVGIYYT